MIRAPHTILTILLAAVFFIALPVSAQPVSITLQPVVINEKAKVRDIITKTVTITNTSSRLLKLYPAVNNVDPNEGEQDFEAATDSQDLADSLANWIELSRGMIELRPGEERAVPFVIRVNMNAVPGTYHASIAFYEGSTRSEAEARGALATSMVNLEVQADIKEILQLNRFFTDNIFFSGDDVLFNYHIENVGNQELQPRGDIRIYNRKGEEVATIDVNKEGRSFAPDQLGQLASVWNAVDGFGRHKAYINIDYGSSQRASVQDTIHFWIVPLKEMLGLLAAGLIAIVFFALYTHKWLDRRHRHAYAHGAHGILPHPEDVHAGHPQAGMVKASAAGTLVHGGFHGAGALLHPAAHGTDHTTDTDEDTAEEELPAPEKKKRSFFGLFRKRARTGVVAQPAQKPAPEPIQQAVTASVPAPVAPVAPVQRQEMAPRVKAPSFREAVPSMRPQLASISTHAGVSAHAMREACGDTINLKKICTPRSEQGVSNNHVINLKRK